MAEIIIYTANLCPFCTMAKRLLDQKGLSYREINVDEKPEMRQEMMQITQRRTVPQIFIDNLHVGGFDDLHALERQGRLNPLVGHIPD